MPSIVAAPPDPQVFPVSLDEAKSHLRIDFSDDDDLINRLIAVATGTLDGPQSPLGRSLMTQEVTMKIDGFPCQGITNLDVFDRMRYFGTGNFPFYRNYFRWNEIPLPLPPYTSGLSIQYQDGDNATQTLDPSVYRLIGGGHGISKVTLVNGQNWPGALYGEESVTLNWTAGYGDTSDKVPAPLRHAILLIIGHLYENRESVYVDNTRGVAVELPQGVEALIAPFRVFS